MGIESILSAVGLAELAANQAFVAQVVVMAFTALFFFSSLAVAIISFRSAAVAHYAKADAEAHLRTARSLASEVRSLTAQVEKSASLMRASHVAGHEQANMDGHNAHDTASSHEGHDEHHVSPVLSQKSYAAHGNDDDHHHNHADDHRAHGDHHADHHGGEVEANEKSLDAAKKAATVPFALLRRKRWDS